MHFGAGPSGECGMAGEVAGINNPIAGRESTVTDHWIGDVEKLRGLESYVVDDPLTPPSNQRCARLTRVCRRPSMAMRCTSCGRVLDDYVDADEIFEQVSGWVYGGGPDGGVVEIEEELIDRHGIFSCAACLWKETTGGSATVPDAVGDEGEEVSR